MLPIPEGKVLPNHRHHPMSGILVPIVAKLRETEIIEDAGIFIDSTDKVRSFNAFLCTLIQWCELLARQSRERS